MGAGYSLDQKGEQKNALGSSTSNPVFAPAVGGFHNSILPMNASGKSSLTADLSADAKASASGSLPVWAWIAIGIVGAAVIIFLKRKKKGK